MRFINNNSKETTTGNKRHFHRKKRAVSHPAVRPGRGADLCRESVGGCSINP